MAGCTGGGADGKEIAEGQQTGHGSEGEIDVGPQLEALGCRWEG